MVDRRRVTYWLSLISALVLASVLLVACDAGQQEGGGGGLGDETPVIEDGLGAGDDDLLGEDDVLEEGDDGLAETPMVEPTIPVDVTEAATEPADDVETTVEATVEMTATTEMTSTLEGSEQVTPEGEVEGQRVVALASELIGMSIQDADGADMAVIDEILVDENGAIQYVIVDAAGFDLDDDLDDDNADDVDDADDADDATSTVTDTTDTTGDDMTVAAGNSFALTWDAIDVQTGAPRDVEPTTDTTDEAFHLIYNGQMTLEEQMPFDDDILDEEGAILDDQMMDDDNTIPAEFMNLLQISEYNEMDLTNTNDDDLGEIEDALIDLKDGTVVYVIVDFGGFLGIGEKSVAVPFDAFEIDVTVADDAEEESIKLDADQERLEAAPEFNYDEWMPNVQDAWDAEWDSFWMNDATNSES